jgi:hypothetical protein
LLYLKYLLYEIPLSYPKSYSQRKLARSSSSTRSVVRVPSPSATRHLHIPSEVRPRNRLLVTPTVSHRLPRTEDSSKTLAVIIVLTFWRHESRVVGITAIGGVEAVVKVMKTFPKCEALQKGACFVLGNLANDTNVTGQKNIIESGGIETLLSAANNHLNTADVCESVCWALSRIVRGSKETPGY